MVSRWYRETQFDLYPTDLRNEVCLYKNWDAENALGHTTAVKFWFSVCGGVSSCPRRPAAAAAGRLGTYPVESTALSFKVPQFQ